MRRLDREQPTEIGGLKAVCYLSQKRWGRVYEYMHERAIYNVLTQGRTVQKGGSNPNPWQITPCS